MTFIRIHLSANENTAYCCTADEPQTLYQYYLWSQTRPLDQSFVIRRHKGLWNFQKWKNRVF